MPRRSQPHSRHLRYRALPLWLQWGLPFTVAAAAIIALVVWVNHETNDVSSEAPVTSKKAILEQNQQADAIMRQQQAPHVVRLKPAATPAAALEHTVAGWLKGQISSGTMTGPLTSGHCVPTAGSSAARVALRCTMVTADVKYPFFGVVQPRRGVVTFCQRVAPPVYGMDDFPLSRRCVGVGQSLRPRI